MKDQAKKGGKPKWQLIEPGILVEVTNEQKTIYSGIMAFVMV